MKFLSKLFALLILLENGMSFLTPPEWDIVLQLIDKKSLKRVILAPNNWAYNEASMFMKELSKKSVESVFMKRGHLRRYLNCPEFKILTKTVVVLKESDMTFADCLDDSSIIHSFRWLLFDASNGTLKQQLPNFYVPFDTSFLLIEKKSPDYYTLTDYYKIKETTPGVFTAYGEFYNNQLKLTKTRWYTRKSNFHGRELITAKFKEDMYLAPKQNMNEAIWQELSQILNFTVKQKLIGYTPTNKTIEIDDEDDAFLDSALYLGNTKKFTYMLGPTTQSRMYMHIKTTKEYVTIERFLMPFATKTWQHLIFWIFGCGFLAFVIEYLSRRYIHKENSHRESHTLAFLPLDSLCNQCGQEISSSFGSRIMLFIIRTTASIFCHSYAATLISFLLLYIPELPFFDLEGLVNDGRYKIIAERNSDVDAYFNVSALPLERLVYEKHLVDVGDWDRLDKEVDRLCRGEKLVLIAFDDDIKNYQPCHIVKIRKPLKVLESGFKLKYMSPVRKLLHMKFSLLRSSGILQRWNQLTLSKISRRHYEYHSDENFKVNMNKIASVYNFFLCGQVLAFIILLIEIGIKKRTIPAYRKQYLD